MEVNSQVAMRLLAAAMKDDSDTSDSDDCESGDDEILLEREARIQETKRKEAGRKKVEDEEDYHKMTEIENRPYQRELLELAKRLNIIVCLPTGSGKTFIALELTNYMLSDAIDKSQKIIFMANNVPLVNQQAKYFSQNLSSSIAKDDNVVRAITGDLNVDIWKQEQWDEVFSMCHIIVASTQIILDAITKGFIKWNQIALLILDECHHAQKQHPMAQLMTIYGERQAKGLTPLPRVLGLTATIIKGQSKPEMIPNDIEDIEKLLCCKAVTTRNYEEVLKSSTSTILKIIPFETNFKTTDPTCQDIVQLIELLETLPKNFGTKDEISIIERIKDPSLTSEEQIYNKDKGVPKFLKSLLSDLLKTYEELGPYLCKLAATLKIYQLVQLIRGLDYMADDDVDDSDEPGEILEAEPTIVMLLELAKTKIFQFMRRLDIKMDLAAQQAGLDKSSDKFHAFKVRNCVSNKVTILWNILMSKRPTGNKEQDEENQICGLIFCQRRITAQVMRWYLEEASKQYPDELGFLKTEVMIGHSTLVGDTELARFTAKRQSTIVHDFHKKKLNLLVATQVVEEGLNVPACNLVLRLDTITTYPSFVQSLGRARKQGALCYALIDAKEEAKEREKIKSYVKYNEKLSSTLELSAIHVGEEDVDEPDMERYAVPIPAFNPSGDPNGAIITATDAVSLIHRYCNGLSRDKIAALFPTAWNKDRNCEKEKRKYYKARVVLPIISPVREVVKGDWMTDKTLAKRSAYLKCCVELYEKGELTENLLPKPRCIEYYLKRCTFLSELKTELVAEKETAVGKIGTKKRVQWYKKATPATLKAATPIQQHSPFSVYKINIKLAAFVGDQRYKGLYDFERNGYSYGIVTTADLDGLPKFILKANYGTLNVTIQRITLNDNNFTNDEIKSLENFQVYMKDSIYNTRNSVLELDPQRCILIAPLSHNSIMGGYEIDWQLIQCLLNLDEEEHLLSEPSEKSRKNLQFSAANYENKILIPWYKEDVKEKPELWCSLQVTNLTAESVFDDASKSGTFQEYFSKKYGVTIYHPNYPLILCKELGKQLNFLTKKHDSYEMRKEMQLKKIVKVVPELMNIHILPASLYVQGKFLPSILHRIYRLLVANELRKKVADYFNWNVDDKSACDEYEEECGSLGAAVEGMTLNTTSEVKGETPERKAKTEEKLKRNIVLIETLDPHRIDWNMIQKPTSSDRMRKSIRDTKYAYPEPPISKSEVWGNLLDINKVKSYSFDIPTDFTVERGPSMTTIMEALTLSNAQDNIDLEKLEVMGDSVLKLIASLHISRSFPLWDEGKMTLLRMQLISNAHMYQLAKKHDLGKILSACFFIPHYNWLPCGFTIPENVENLVVSKRLDYSDFNSLPQSVLQQSETLERHLGEIRALALNRKKTREDKDKVTHTNYTHSRIGDKSLADSMEAIIGAYYVNGGIDGAFRIMKYLGMRGPLEDGTATVYSRQSTMGPVKPSYFESTANNNAQKIVPLLKDLEEILKYNFKNPWIAVEALTHPTYYMGNRVTPCYERLEYLGDAILDFLVTNYILKETKITDPGDITDLRSALVNNVTFASLAVRYGFHNFLKYDSEPLGKFIGQFVVYQEGNDHIVSDPYKLLTDYECPAVQEIDVPKVLGDIFESLAGAVFIDSGMSIDTVWKVFYRLMKNEFEQFSKQIPKSPLRELYEQFPGKVKFIKPSSASEDSLKENPKKKNSDSSPQRQFVYLKVPSQVRSVIGVGANIKQAKQAAAKYLVRKLKCPDDTIN